MILSASAASVELGRNIICDRESTINFACAAQEMRVLRTVETLPCSVLTAALRLFCPLSPLNTTGTPVHVQVTSPYTPQTGSGKCHPRPSTHPRYNIFVYGCSELTYKVIREWEEATYMRMLASRDLTKEHPRQNSGSITALLNLKPHWQTGKPSYSWFDDSSLVPDKSGQDA